MPNQPKQKPPKVDLRDDLLKELRVKVRTSVYDSIIKYIAFHEESMRFKPDESKVVDRGLEAFFVSDEGFQMYLKKVSKNGVQGRQPMSVDEGGKGGGQS
jgi:hypothetical protein